MVTQINLNIKEALSEYRRTIFPDLTDDMPPKREKGKPDSFDWESWTRRHDEPVETFLECLRVEKPQSGVLKTFVLYPESQERIPVPAGYWSIFAAPLTLEHGTLQDPGRTVGLKNCAGWDVVVDQLSFDIWLEQHVKRDPKSKGQTTETKIDVPVAGEYSPAYRSPYMALAIEAEAHFGTALSKEKAETVSNWISARARTKGIPGVSVRLARSMVTMLRLPNQQIGGNSGWSKKD